MVARCDLEFMMRALNLARQGEGFVEPNPMVGCVVVRDGAIVAEGFHQRFGGPHAEIEALRVAGDRAMGATMYVTLEPCCHTGKTPPCSNAVIAAGIKRVVIAQSDPFPAVNGDGLKQLASAGIEVEVGVCETEARRLNAPYLKLLQAKRPWVIAKWAMSLDGKIATHTGDSQWISGEPSRAIVHALRGRMDAIIIGSGTATKDDPLLTARPTGPRTALRVIVDSQATLASTSQLVQTARQTPVLIAVGSSTPVAEQTRLRAAECEVFVCEGRNHTERLTELLTELGRRRLTNVLVEGGGRLLGSFRDLGLIDEVHAFIAPRLIGGAKAVSAMEATGAGLVSESQTLTDVEVRQCGCDVYVSGRTANISS